MGPDLGTNSLQRLSADNTGRQRVNAMVEFEAYCGAFAHYGRTFKTDFLISNLVKFPMFRDFILTLHSFTKAPK